MSIQHDRDDSLEFSLVKYGLSKSKSELKQENQHKRAEWKKLRSKEQKLAMIWGVWRIFIVSHAVTPIQKTQIGGND